MTVLSIVMPALNEGARIAEALAPLQGLRAQGAEIIFVDGGSGDDTLAQARPFVEHALVAPRGRARQMNAGAATARGETLLFLHADTRLPDGARALIVDGLAASGRLWGRFDVRIEGRSRWLPIVGAMMNARSRLSGICTGDQAMFVRRDAFERLGGFTDIPLMEDIALSKALKRIGPPLALRARVQTSGRRWDKHGGARTILLMWRLRLEYALGADPADLARRYGYAPP